MNHTVARMEVTKFIGKVLGIDTQRMLFLPFERPADLALLEHWLVDNGEDFTVSYIAAQHKFLAVLDMEGTHVPCLVIHEDKGIAFTTAFCITHGDTECGFKRSQNIDFTILGDL